MLEFTAMTLNTLNLEIYLARWIIEDGNYDDFCVGDRRKFALEFWAPTPLTKSAENVMALREQSGHSYDVTGKLVFTSDGVWVIDCSVLAYSEGESEIDGGCKVGDFVQGSLRFGVDPFFYFEQNYKIPNIPPLIYEWQVNSIEQDTTPYILSNDARTYIRDERRAATNLSVGRPRTLSSPTKARSLFSIVQGSEQLRATSCRPAGVSTNAVHANMEFQVSEYATSRDFERSRVGPTS
jgi:hypothetical protein